MKTILGLLVAGGVFFGIVWYQEGENPLNKLQENNPARHLDAAQKAADLYGSATQKRIDAEFGQ